MTLAMDVRENSVYRLPPVPRAGPCQISGSCRRTPTPDLSLRPSPWQVCDTNDLYCICKNDSSINDNRYFDSLCLFRECTDTDARKGFIKSFVSACSRSERQLTKIPAEWEPYLPTSLSQTTQTLSSTTNVASSGVVNSTPPPASTTTTSSSITTLKRSTSSSVSTMTQAASASQAAAQPSSTNWADHQKPVCGITEDCLVDKDKTAPCGLEDLKCICRNSNSIANNNFFDQNCLFAKCRTDLGRREWIDAFAYACYEDGNLLIDMNDQWRPYVPGWYPMSSSSTPPTGTGAPSATATVITGAPTPALSEGAIAGIAVGGLAAVILMTICGFCFWRSNKKLKRRSREVAHMADALQQGGVAQRIGELGRPGYNTPPEVQLRLGYDYPLPPSLIRNDSYSHYSPAKTDENLTPSPLRVRKASGGYTMPEYATPVVRDNYDPNGFYTPKPVPEHQYGLGRRRSDLHDSVASFGTTAVTSNMGTTAVTSSPPLRYSHSPDDMPQYPRYSYSPDDPTAPAFDDRDRIVQYDAHGRKITPPTITFG